jgi:nicotinate-nucleotide pyrophosphorylase (carboxylating)
MGSIDAAIDEALKTTDSVLVEVEVESLDQVERALASHADRLLLDNFSLDMLREAVSLRDRTARDKTLEASGGVAIATVRAIAETGVDYISVGAMTKSVDAVDFSLRIVDGI